MTTGKIDGKRRKLIKIFERLAAWLGRSTIELLKTPVIVGNGGTHLHSAADATPGGN